MSRRWQRLKTERGAWSITLWIYADWLSCLTGKGSRIGCFPSLLWLCHWHILTDEFNLTSFSPPWLHRYIKWIWNWAQRLKLQLVYRSLHIMCAATKIKSEICLICKGHLYMHKPPGVSCLDFLLGTLIYILVWLTDSLFYLCSFCTHWTLLLLPRSSILCRLCFMWSHR